MDFLEKMWTKLSTPMNNRKFKFEFKFQKNDINILFVLLNRDGTRSIALYASLY